MSSFDYQVHYNFNKILMLQEPLLVVGAFYILFFTVIIYVRLDFAITKVCKHLCISLKTAWFVFIYPYAHLLLQFLQSLDLHAF